MPTSSSRSAGLPPLAFAAGEPAGIGPELLVQLAQQPSPVPRVAVTDPELLQQRADLLGLPLRLTPADEARGPQPAGELAVLPVPLTVPSRPGQLDARNAAHVLATLDAAIDGCVEERFAAMVTAPVHKGILNEAGHAFSGHTEYLAQRLRVDQVVMMLPAMTSGWRWSPPTCPCARWRMPSLRPRWSRCCASSTATCSATSAGHSRAWRCWGSTPMPARAATWAGRKWRSSSPAWSGCAARA